MVVLSGEFSLVAVLAAVVVIVAMLLPYVAARTGDVASVKPDTIVCSFAKTFFGTIRSSVYVSI